MRGRICAACWRAPRTERAIVCSPARIATLATSVASAAIRARIVKELEVPIERWSPSPRPLGPLDQNDGALADHVVEAEIARLVGVAQTVAIHVIEGSGAGVVMMHERVRGTGGPRAGAQAAADGLDEARLPRPQLSGQPDYRGRAELAAEVFTEPAELARGEAHRP